MPFDAKGPVYLLFNQAKAFSTVFLSILIKNQHEGGEVFYTRSLLCLIFALLHGVKEGPVVIFEITLQF